MATPNKKSAEAFIAALLQQKNFEGVVDGVGYVKCHKDMTWVAPMSPSPSIPRGRALPSEKYTVYIERLDKDKLDDTPYFKKLFPELTNEGLARAITTRSGNNKEVQLGRELYYELLSSQDVKVDINFKTGMVSLRLPKSQEYNGKDYPLYNRSKNGVYSLDKDKKETTVSLEDIQNGTLGYSAKFLLIGDQQITSNPYQVKVDYWDMLQNFGEYRPYIIGNKFTISFSIEGATVVGAGASLDFTWLFDGVDRSLYPYTTITVHALGSTGGGASMGTSAGFGMFEGGINDLNRRTLSGFSQGIEVSGVYGLGGGVGGSRSVLPEKNSFWTSGYVSLNLGGDGSPVTGISYKTFISRTTESLHLSPEKLAKYLNK